MEEKLDLISYILQQSTTQSHLFNGPTNQDRLWRDGRYGEISYPIISAVRIPSIFANQ